MEVSATLRHVEPWNSRLNATFSLAARCKERLRTLTSPPGPSFTCTYKKVTFIKSSWALILYNNVIKQ